MSKTFTLFRRNSVTENVMIKDYDFFLPLEASKKADGKRHTARTLSTNTTTSTTLPKSDNPKLHLHPAMSQSFRRRATLTDCQQRAREVRQLGNGEVNFS